MSGWITVRVYAGAERDAAIAALFDAGALGIEEAADAIITQVPTQSAADSLVRAVAGAVPEARMETVRLPSVDWSEQWKRGIGVQTLGALSIAPPWLAEGLDATRTIVIEPAMAFGTGEHATTRGVVRLLQHVVVAGDHVADLGAGSAVLAIAAAKLGAGRVAAIELDHDAIGNAEENVARNDVGDRVTVIEGDAAVLLPLVAPVNVITANIISSVLIDLLPLFDAALEDRGRAILSGILLEERETMTRAMESSGWRIDAEDCEDIWWTVSIARR